MSGWLDELLHPEQPGQPEEIGPATARPPAKAGGSSDPGDIYAFGPNFVSFVTERFAAVEHLLASALSVRGRRREEEGFRIQATGQTDGTGAATIVLFEVNPGQKLVLHRLYVHAQGYTWAVPFTNAAGTISIQTDGMSWTASSLASGLPTYYTAGRLHAVEGQDGERVALVLTGGPASTRIECRGLAVLGPVTGDDG